MRSEKSIKSAREFRRVLESGRRVRRSNMTVHVVTRARPDLEGRLGLAVRSGRGGAVARNRVRRRLRAAFERCGATGYDVVIRADERVASAAFDALVEDLCGAVHGGTPR